VSFLLVIYLHSPTLVNEDKFGGEVDKQTTIGERRESRERLLGINEYDTNIDQLVH